MSDYELILRLVCISLGTFIALAALIVSNYARREQSGLVYLCALLVAAILVISGVFVEFPGPVPA